MIKQSLRDVSIELNEGEFVGVGANGGGKVRHRHSGLATISRDNRMYGNRSTIRPI